MAECGGVGRQNLTEQLAETDNGCAILVGLQAQEFADVGFNRRQFVGNFRHFGAVILRNTRRIRFLLASTYPYQALFRHVHTALDTG